MFLTIVNTWKKYVLVFKWLLNYFHLNYKNYINIKNVCVFKVDIHGWQSIEMVTSSASVTEHKIRSIRNENNGI